MMISRTGRYRVSYIWMDFLVNSRSYQTIVYSGFSIWAIGCGCISTITPSTKKGVLVVFMLLVGLGGGQVGKLIISQSSCSNKP